MPKYTDAESSFKIIPEGDYILAVCEFHICLSTGAKTKGCDKYEVTFVVEGQDTKVKEQLLDHPSCSWKIDTFLKSAGIRKLAKGQDFEFDEDTADEKDVTWVNPMGLRCAAHVIVDETYISPTTKQPVPKNRVSVFYTDRPALPPDPNYRVMKTTK